jgi:hypothetical protein
MFFSVLYNNLIISAAIRTVIDCCRLEILSIFYNLVFVPACIGYFIFNSLPICYEYFLYIYKICLSEMRLVRREFLIIDGFSLWLVFGILVCYLIRIVIFTALIFSNPLP